MLRKIAETTTFELAEVTKIRKVRWKRDEKYMAVSEKFEEILQDVHVAIGHKGETKTHKKLQERYSNILKSAVCAFIADCERCVEKSKKKCAREVVVRSILVSALNDRGQVDFVNYQSLPDGLYKFNFHYKEHLTKSTHSSVPSRARKPPRSHTRCSSSFLSSVPPPHVCSSLTTDENS